MMDVAMALIHTQFILSGVAGGFLHSLIDRKLDAGEVARYISASAILSNFMTPLVLIFVPSIPEGAGVGIGFGLGYGVFRICQFADRYIDKNLKPFEGPEHD